MASRQLEIVHDESDDAFMIAWLKKQGDFRCLPAVAESESRNEPQMLADCVERRAVVFFSELTSLVIEGSHISEENPHKIVYANSENDGLIFEWVKNTLSNGSTYTASGGKGARIYNRDPDVPNPATEKTRKFVNAIFRWIRRTYPWVSEGKHSMYVGPSIGARIQSGQATLVYPSGKPVMLIHNPKYQGTKIV